jgi:hypothetical protein
MLFTNILTRFILLASILLLSFSGCKKYEEDDYWFTLRSINKRLVGKKELVECTYNGADSMAFFKRYFGDFYFDFSGDKKDQYGIPYLNVYSKGSNELLNVEGDSKWAFDHGKTHDVVTITLILNDTEQFNMSGTIKKLTKNEMHLDAGNFPFVQTATALNLNNLLTLKFKKYED